MTTYERVIEVIVNQLSVEKDTLTPETSLLGDLEIDSLDIVELLMNFEEEFDVSINDEASENIKTIEDVVTYIDNELSKD